MRTATVFNFLVEATLIGAAVMTGVLLVRLLLRKSLGNRFVRALWLLVALRLLLPIALPNPLMNALKPTLSLDAGIRPMADQVRTRVGDAATALYWKAVGHNDVLPLTEILRRLAQAAGNGSLSWMIMVIYSAGALGMAGGIIADNVRFRRRLRQRQPSAEAQSLWEAVCAEYGIKQVPKLVLSETLPAACAIGCFRPYVAAPANLSGEALQASMRHACAHVRLRTGFWALIRDLCLCVHWFNPLVWACAFLSRTDDALACDEWAAAPLEPQDRERYASWLIHQRDSAFSAPAMWITASCVTMRARTLAQRIRQVLHPQPVQPVALGAVCLAAALALSVMFATAEQSSREYIPLMTLPPLTTAKDDLNTSEGAEAYARRFLALEGVAGSVPSEYAVVMQTGDGWHVSLLMPSGETCEVAFDLQGTILYYEDTAVIVSAIRPLAEPITVETEEGRAWCAFLASFLERHIPAVYQAFEAMDIASSGRIDGEEFLTIHLLDADGEVLYVADIQAAPEGRIYRFLRAE